MKDLPRHIKKLNKQIERSKRKEEAEEQTIQKMEEEEKYMEKYRRAESKQQKRKKEKLAIKKERLITIPSPKTPEERNKDMKRRVPIIRQIAHRTTTKPK